MINQSYVRGSVWWVDLPMIEGSHVQGGSRPCVIISNREVDEKCGVLTVCPLSTRQDDFSTHVPVCIKKPGQVLCEQLITIDVSKITDYCGQLDDETMKDVSAVLVQYICKNYVK